MNDGLFFDPNDGGNNQAVRAFIQPVQEMLFSFMANASQRLPMPLTDDWQAPPLLPEQGRPLADILPELEAMLSRSMNVAHPGFIGHMDSIASVPGMMGQWLSAAINNNMLSVEMAPALVRLEHQSLRTIANWFGLGPQAGGTMLAGGSLANLQALAVARNSVLNCQQHGLPASHAADGSHGTGKYVILASGSAHTSLQKATMLLGLGSAAVRAVATDDRARMCVADLALQLQTCRQQGETVLSVVATAGSTISGSIDPIAQIARLCQQYQIWLHVDAAYGGALILSSAWRHLLDGIQHADSITFNPQKWLYLPKTCVTLLFRDVTRWQRALRISAPYMGVDDDELINPGEISVQGTRHADILKLWFSLQCIGRTGQAQLIDQCMNRTQFFTRQLLSRPWLELLHEPQLNLVCFRATPGQDVLEPNAFNRAMAEYLNQQNLAFFSLPAIQGERWLRAVLLNPHLTEQHLLAIMAGMDEFYQTHARAQPMPSILP